MYNFYFKSAKGTRCDSLWFSVVLCVKKCFTENHRGFTENHRE